MSVEVQVPDQRQTGHGGGKRGDEATFSRRNGPVISVFGDIIVHQRSINQSIVLVKHRWYAGRQDDHGGRHSLS